MSTSENKQLNFSNFIDPVSYTTGRGKMTTVQYKLNWYDNKLTFIGNEMNCNKYEVKVPSFLPNISYIFYDTTSLWWLIARFNKIIFPLEEIKPGTILYIPTLSEVSKYLNKASGQQTGSSNRTVTI